MTMANELRGEREIRMCGESYCLVPDFESLHEVEKLAGCSLTMLAMKFARSDVRITEVAALIYGGIKGSGEKKLTFAEVGKLVQRHGLVRLIPAAGEFLTAAISGDGDPETGEEKPA